jgi:hypothetical protein
MSGRLAIPPLTPDAVRIVERLRHRLALGIEVVDAVTGLAAFGPPVVELERIGPFAMPPGERRLPPFDRPRVARAWAGTVRRFMELAAERGVPGDWLLRLHGDPAAPLLGWDPRRDARRHVPRRLLLRPVLEAGPGGVPVVTGSPAPNARRCALWPGAAFPLAGAATAIRGRVMHDATRPMPWARVLATVPAAETDLALARPVGHAAADDRGDYLLVLGPAAVAGAALPPAAQIRLWAFGPAAPPAADAADGLAGLPVEDAGTAADGPLLQGERIPAAYTEPPATARPPATRTVAVTLSTVLSGPDATLTLP